MFWNAPANDGGSTITGYTITAVGPGGPLTPTMVGASSTTAIVTGLTNGTSYTFTITADNSVGASPAASSTAVTPAGAPSAPASVSASGGDQFATVSWTAPISDGGSAIAQYTITPIGPGGALTSVVVGAGVTSTIITGLTNGTAYTFSVTAANDAAGSAATTSGSVTPAGAPLAPTGAGATAGDQQATVTWTAPNDNGSAVTGYTITPDGPSGPLSPITVAGGSTSTLVTGLTNGASYTFAITATNSVGTSSTATIGPTVPRGAPAAPTGVTATAGDQQASVFWTSPTDDGGTPLVSYTITPIGPGGPLTPTVVAGTVTAAVVTGLVDGTSYTFSVTADNAVGSSATAVSGSVTPTAPPPMATAPDAPTLPTATVGPGASQVTVSWAPPGSDGGSPVTSYTLTELNGATVVSSWELPATATSQLVTGLTAGTTYTFSIVATNSVGPSIAAATSPITAVAAPGPVSAVTATAGNTQATVSWTAPATDGGSPVTSYTVTPTGPSGALTPVTVTAPTTTATITGLTNGATYTFSVTATNAYGTSTPVSSTAVTALTVNPDTAYVVKQQPITIHVLANDHGAIVAANTTVTVAPAHGSATANSDGTITYQPTGWTGTDQFTYQACDSHGNCAIALVTVHVLDHGQGHTDYSGLDLSGANLTGIDFTGADLSNTNLTGANLTGVNFTGADLDGAILTGATITNNVNFTGADLIGAHLAGDNLAGVNFTGADLSGADLSNANLTNANLNNVTVTGATNLTGANLSGVHGGPPPQIANQTFSTGTLGAVTVNLLSLVTDPQAPINPNSIVITQQPAHGTLVLHANGTATYTPNLLFLGNDQFSFQVANVLTFTATGAVHLQVGLL